jgi:hypothetical protein
MITFVVTSYSSIASRHFVGKLCLLTRIRRMMQAGNCICLLLDWINLKMKTICSSEAWTDLYRTARCNSNTIVWSRNFKTSKTVGVLCFTAPSVMEVPSLCPALQYAQAHLPRFPWLECKLLLRYTHSYMFYLPICWLCLYHGKVFFLF